ncbi:odorant receptor 4-like isoform X2 [Leptopilina boulardi]|uniref:odorant receptor 4-like isoform X2 n=1 Tax=Leptopilina boulardi TaxID=63433 RepID=UPI0021F51C59|nr:odorant receptor 4-like isoform X2 [Leptopilina boulardi]
MDIIIKPHYDITRFFIIFTGLSRHHPLWFNFIPQSILFFVFFTFLSVQIAGMTEVLNDIDMVLECFPPILYTLMGLILYINVMVHAKQINDVFYKMRDDWDTLTSEYEVDIMNKYGRKCRYLTIIYIIGMFGHLAVYHLSHGLPVLINHFKKNDKPRPYLFILKLGDFQKHYVLVSFYSYLAGYVGSFGMVNGYTILLMFLEHACGVFEIIGHRLTVIIQENPESINKVGSRKKLQREINICVTMHRRVLLFINDIQNIFSIPYLFVFGFSVIMLSISGVQSVLSMNRDARDSVRFGVFTICQVMHIYILTIPTQHLLDNSLILSTCIYDTNWYHLSTEGKRLLLMVMRKGSEPTTFIVGKIFILSLQFFTKVLQTSMSYFTVLMSVRG